mmetsp:Transcript_15487/g.50576  ORF Transcript_15487/g.50576 Transcript_15487/m.50576 type:complete len:271 (+) Transcript_15487:176-988(+)|eukprot:scaffold8850_cov134-Isochrysis_galbana.AAC.22
MSQSRLASGVQPGKLRVSHAAPVVVPRALLHHLEGGVEAAVLQVVHHQGLWRRRPVQRPSLRHPGAVGVAPEVVHPPANVDVVDRLVRVREPVSGGGVFVLLPLELVPARAARLGHPLAHLPILGHPAQQRAREDVACACPVREGRHGPKLVARTHPARGTGCAPAPPKVVERVLCEPAKPAPLAARACKAGVRDERSPVDGSRERVPEAPSLLEHGQELAQVDRGVVVHLAHERDARHRRRREVEEGELLEGWHAAAHLCVVAILGLGA